jgi:hypothetical protein
MRIARQHYRLQAPSVSQTWFTVGLYIRVLYTDSCAGDAKIFEKCRQASHQFEAKFEILQPKMIL